MGTRNVSSMTLLKKLLRQRRLDCNILTANIDLAFSVGIHPKSTISYVLETISVVKC